MIMGTIGTPFLSLQSIRLFFVLGEKYSILFFTSDPVFL